MENKYTTKDEIINYITESLNKEVSLSSLSDELKLDKTEIMGYIRILKQNGMGIKFQEKNGDVFLVKSYSPDMSKENFYKISEDVNSNTRIAFISDTRFGSKQEQVSILNDMYTKFLEDGVKYVVIVGNLIEGLYKGENERNFGNSLISNDAISQVEHFIDYFPHIDGIETLFITGKNEETCYKDINVGKYIEDNRDDLKFLGPKSATLLLNKVSIKLEQLKNGDAYTIAYPPQKYSRSLSSYEDYDVIVLGGTSSMQEFPSIRDSMMFSVPAASARTPKMRNKSHQNTIGSLILDISYNKNGSLKRCTPLFIPYYKPDNKTYVDVSALNMIKVDNQYEQINDKEKEKEDTCYFDIAKKFYKSLKKEQTFNDARNRFELSDEGLYGMLELCEHYGFPVRLDEYNNESVIIKTFKKKSNAIIKLPKEELNYEEILVVSDSHYGSIYSQPSMVNTAAYEAYNRGIKRAFHIGDVSDGDYSRIRPIHNYEVFLYGATGHKDYIVQNLPKYPGLTWEIIQGSHDQTHLFNYGMTLIEEVAKKRPDVIYLGQDRADVNLGKCKIELFHPGGGTSRILSTKPQNGIDQLSSKTKPNISLRGHYHKVYYMLYRNIHTFLCPCNVDQSSFMMKNEIPNLMGDLFLKIWYDDNGSVHYIEPDFMIFNQEDVRKDDYLNPTKYIKNKIITLKK